jgi:hypothetical protein
MEHDQRRDEKNRHDRDDEERTAGSHVEAELNVEAELSVEAS